MISKENSSSYGLDIGLNHKEFFEQVSLGDEIKIGFDGLIVRVVSIDQSILRLESEVLHIGNTDINKAVDISNKSLILSDFTDYDTQCLLESKKHGVREVYISFCSSSNSIQNAKSLLLDANWSAETLPKIIAKIENRMGLLNLEAIANQADGILIDRGDLSREIKISMIPGIVNQIVERCSAIGKPCYIATNVLDSMLTDSLPSRAEISDIYNLLSIGISGFVLAAEMAIGDHPVESLEVIKYMSSVFHHQKNKTGIIPHPSEVIPSIKEPLLSWL